jgi:pimeloyl-ACP methyl ester carboxylesterase
MSNGSSNRSKDIQAAGKLTVEAIIGITDIVESIHHTIINLGRVSGKSDPPRTRGITGMVYNNIRTITKVVGKGLDVSLNQLSTLIEESDSSPEREAFLAALNGVLGDYLMTSGNPLAIPMRFRREGKPLTDADVREIVRQANGRLLIMVHGSSMNDLQWNRADHDHGAALSRDLGLTPLYLHYNTGLHTSENGQSFANLLETCLAETPQPGELYLVAHSMGGLVARSAIHYGNLFGHTWQKSLKKIVFVGTPHHGAVLEKGGSWIDNLLEINPYSAPLARLGKIRSSGVTDLRFGNVVTEDWQGQNRFEFGGDTRTPVPLPEGVQCYAIAGTIGKEATMTGDGLIGDGLVTVASALGRHRKPERQLLFPETQQWIGRGMNHFEMLNHPEAYETIKKWLAI